MYHGVYNKCKSKMYVHVSSKAGTEDMEAHSKVSILLIKWYNIIWRESVMI